MIEFEKLISLPGILSTFGKMPTSKELRFSTDTRTIEKAESFIAIEGPSFRPMTFIKQLDSAPVIIYQKNEYNDQIANKFKERNYFIAVKDAVLFLQEIAKNISLEFQNKNGKLIAICGSNGKTTTKEMLFHLLNSTKGHAHCTQKNNNNHIGVPLTLLQLTPEDRFCVLELGSNHPGEIATLCEIAQPAYGVSTNIGDTHLEFFESRKNVFKEEGHLYHAVDSLKRDKVFFLNMNDEYLNTLPIRPFVRTYGSEDQWSTQINAKHDEVLIAQNGETLKIKNSQLTGEHNFFNLGVALMIATTITGEGLGHFKKSAESFLPTANRSQWLTIKESKVFLDAYNANPSSMKAALMGFRAQVMKDNVELSKCSIVLGDMNELGAEAASYHEELGRFCVELGFSQLYFVGNFSGSYLKGANGAGRGLNSRKDFGPELKKEILDRPRCFIKGSRSLQLESIVDIN